MEIERWIWIQKIFFKIRPLLLMKLCRWREREGGRESGERTLFGEKEFTTNYRKSERAKKYARKHTHTRTQDVSATVYIFQHCIGI